MARVVLNREMSRRYAGGEIELEVEAADIRQLLRAIEVRYPGLGTALGSGMAVAIDGEIYADPLLEPLAPECEVHFLPPIEGGWADG